MMKIDHQEDYFLSFPLIVCLSSKNCRIIMVWTWRRKGLKKKYRHSGNMQDPRGGKVASLQFRALFFFGFRLFLPFFLGEVVFIFAVWSSLFLG